MNVANVLIVDDEPLARAALVKLLEPEPQMRVVAEAGTGTAALALLQTTTLDLVFLDLHLPDMTGIEMLQKIPAGRRPAVIFVTARDDFAVKAFELHAIDYLVKPFTDDRFYRAIGRVQRPPRLTALAASVDSLLQRWQPASRAALATASTREHPEQFTAKSGGDIHVFQFENIKWVEAQGDYLKIHSTKGNALVRETMRRFLERAAGGRFVRVHKSAIVNLAFVKRLEPIHSGDYRLELNDGAVLRVSRHFREDVQAALLR